MKEVGLWLLGSGVVALAIGGWIQANRIDHMENKITALEKRMGQVAFVVGKAEKIIEEEDGRFTTLERRQDVDHMLIVNVLDRVVVLEKRTQHLHYMDKEVEVEP